MSFIYADGAVGQHFSPGRQPIDAEEANANTAHGGIICGDGFDGLTCTREKGHSRDHAASGGYGSHFVVVGRWVRPLVAYFPHCQICRAALVWAPGLNRDCPNGHGTFAPRVVLRGVFAPRAVGGRVVQPDRCECGAAKIGCGKNAPGHSSWCPWASS